MTNTKFAAVTTESIERLEQFIPIVERVHGKEHPEFIEIRKLFNQLNAKMQAAGAENPDLKKGFKELRKATNNYEIPPNVCESYEAVYEMLENLEQTYFEK